MLAIAFQSKWLIAKFFAVALLHVLKFLFKMVSISLSACYIWLLAFMIDTGFTILLRDYHKAKRPRSEPIRFSFDGCQYEPFVTGIREEITMYLATEVITAEMTAETLDRMLPANQYLRYPHTFVPSSVLFAWRLWETIVQFAFQIPHDHVLQDKLVDLIVTLAKRPAVLVRYQNSLLRFWDALPQYDTFITVYGNMFFFDNEWRHTGDDVHKTNLMAFITRVQATGLPHGLMFGANYSFYTALDARKLDVLPWAIFWIDHCGEYLWWYVSQPSNNGVIFTKRMWMHYMEQFRKMACDGGNERYVRMICQDTFYTMARLTRSTPNPKFDNMGQKHWADRLEREGPQGHFVEPIAPDFWEEEEEAGEAYEEYEVDDDDQTTWYWNGEDYALRGAEGEIGGGWIPYRPHTLDREEDPYGFHPLRPIGGYQMYSDVTEEDENVIARAA